MINREQVIRDLSAAFSHAEENGVLDELKEILSFGDACSGRDAIQAVIEAIDQLADPIYKQADEDFEARRGNRDHLWQED